MLDTQRFSSPTLRALGVGALLATSLMACKTSRGVAADGTQDDAMQPPPVNIARLSPEECKRRVEAMARQERDMRSSPQEVVDTAQPERRTMQWDNANNPCPEQSSSTPAPESDPVLLTTQIDVALEENAPEKARRILPSLFSDETRSDRSLKDLTDRVMLAYMPTRIARHQPTSDITRLDDGQLLCTATTSPQPEVSDLQAATEVVTGDTIHLSCALPPRASNVTSSVLLLRMRQSTGHYTRITTMDTGDLANLPAGQNILQASITLEEDFLEENEQAYIEAILFDAQNTTDLATALSHGGFFWFDAP
tara:strand:+ start:328 stop:1254 length:927 start_codon:yes stop_codon:yes gene_type:complete